MALERATTVIAFADFLNPGLEEHATVVFPAESYAEKDGTVTHPDGRIQRVRQAIKRPGEVRPQRTVLLDIISGLLGQPLQIGSSAMLTAQCFAAVPFYGRLSLEEIGGTRRALAGARGRGQARRARAPRRRSSRRRPRACTRTAA